MLSTIFSLYVTVFLWYPLLYCSARDTITPSNPILGNGETLISAGKIFELGFFTPDGNSNNSRYVGIWYYGLKPQTVVWVANRDHPLNDSTGVFGISEDGSTLKVLDNLERSWSGNRTAKLMDSGNLVLSDDDELEMNSSVYIWQSFDNPTDTFLRGMKMDENLKLTSWESRGNPGSGKFVFQQDQGENQFIISNRSMTYWKGGVSGKFISFNEMPSAIAYLLSNFSKNISIHQPTKGNKFNSMILSSTYNNTKLVMSFSGNIQYLGWDTRYGNWVLIWSEPRDKCSVYNACGNFGSCNSNNNGLGLLCKCLRGFEPSSPEEWNSGDFSGGCLRKSSTCKKNATTFLGLKMVKVGNQFSEFRADTSEDCRHECLKHCNCQAYSYDEANITRLGGTGSTNCWTCLEDLINVQEECEYADGGLDLYLRVTASDLGSFHKKTSLSPILVVTSTTVVVLVVLSFTIVYISYMRRRRVAKRKENRESIQGNQALQFYDSERRVKELIDSGHFREDDKKGIDVPFFDLESILAITDNFSDANKLGQGGFGPVYKGKFPGGKEIAVKRLSSGSGQGLEEFKNEVVLIAKLQHRNLVRLLGYCVEGDEKILVYEYMPNKSLDSFIFDRTLCKLLNWEKRFDIILGIARGLLYLHQDSRLRIIHRDLKTSNILLDEEMNPKISDFGLARIFGGKQTEANTNRVVGTYGYMSPEYALDGFFSVKSDVFSFGVVVLEIISGKRNTGFYQSEQALSLLGHAWRLWKENKALDLMDRTLYETCNTNEFMKCINVGLLCVQEDPNDRPTMSNAVFMLGGETASLPTPKQPAFIVRRGLPSTASTSSKPEIFSNNELTASIEEGQ